LLGNRRAILQATGLGRQSSAASSALAAAHGANIDVNTNLDPDLSALATATRTELANRRDATITYQGLARALGLKPPHTIHRVIQALELTMREDAAAGRPFIAARVISRTRGGLPAPGFFNLATRLGRHDGDESGAAARAFHVAQLRSLLA
jgi:hypothetical protein